MTPRRIHKLPANLTFDTTNSRYRWRNPITGQKFWLGKDRIKAEQRAKKLNKAVALVREQREANKGVPTVDGIIDLYIENVIVTKPDADVNRIEFEYLEDVDA